MLFVCWNMDETDASNTDLHGFKYFALFRNTDLTDASNTEVHGFFINITFKKERRFK